MRRRDPLCRQWPEPAAGTPAGSASYAPETLLLHGVTPPEGDERVRGVVLGLPDGTGSVTRVGLCNPPGEIYREVVLHGPVQLLYLWAGLNALGWRQCSPVEPGISKYAVLFGRGPAEKRPLEGGRNQVPSG